MYQCSSLWQISKVSAASHVSLRGGQGQMTWMRPHSSVLNLGPSVTKSYANFLTGFTKDLLSSKQKRGKKKVKCSDCSKIYGVSFHSFTSIFQLQFKPPNSPFIIFLIKYLKNKVGYGAGGKMIKAGDHEDFLRKWWVTMKCPVAELLFQKFIH